MLISSSDTPNIHVATGDPEVPEMRRHFQGAQSGVAGRRARAQSCGRKDERCSDLTLLPPSLRLSPAENPISQFLQSLRIRFACFQGARAFFERFVKKRKEALTQRCEVPLFGARLVIEYRL